VELPLKTHYRLVTVCRLTTWKGVDGLIEVVAALPEMGLAVVGDGPERAKLEALAEQLGVLPRVYFAGQVPRAEVAAYLEACDLFVLNSRYEGLPHVLLEAMAAGLPIVATDVGGIGEVVQPGRNGWLIRPGDPAQLRRAILWALKDADLRARCSEDRAQALQRFSPSAMADATEQILKRAAA
jgi:glycosyltransferase involved in cell wall biosynthesis